MGCHVNCTSFARNSRAALRANHLGNNLMERSRFVKDERIMVSHINHKYFNDKNLIPASYTVHHKTNALRNRAFLKKTNHQLMYIWR